jgi:hypothetical protein
MPEYKGISVFKQAKYQIPDAYLQSFVKACPSVFGVVAVKKKDGSGLEIQALDKPPDMDHLKKINKAFENHRMLFFGGNFPNNFIKDAAQPYRVLAKDKTALVAATLCGDFAKLVPPGDTNHPPQFYAAHMFILPKLQQLFRLCKEDINALYQEIKGPQFTKEMKELIGPQGGIIAFFLDTPEAPSYISFHKSLPTHKQFLWGDVSDVLDYQTGIVEAPTTEPVPAPKKSTKFVVEPDDDEEEVTYTPKKKAVKKADKAEVKAEVPIITNSGGDKIIKEYTDAQTGGIMRLVLVDGKEVLLWYPPYTMTKRRALRRLYKAVSTKELTNKEIDARIGVVPKDQRFYKSFAEMGAALTKIPDSAISDADAPRHQAPKAEATERTPAKNKVTGSTVNAPLAESEDKVGSNIYSGLSKKAQYDVLKILKTLDNNGQSILHPEIDLEDTNPSMYKEIGYPDMDHMFGWKPETRLAICQASPEFASRYIGDLIRFCYNLKKELDKFYENEDIITYTPKKKQAKG